MAGENAIGGTLAGGGFPANAEWRRRQLPEPVAEYTLASEGRDGSTLDLAIAIGASLGPEGLDNAL
jgi:3-oxosteroid 1-dehydrogenase